MFNNKDGITYGSCMDVCIDCKKENKQTKAGDLEYQEVFRLYNSGNPICYCMNHFKKMLGKYMLVDPNFFDSDISEEDNLLTNCSTNCDTIEETNGKEIDKQIEEPIDNKEKKTTTKKRATTKKKDDDSKTAE